MCETGRFLTGIVGASVAVSLTLDLCWCYVYFRDTRGAGKTGRQCVVRRRGGAGEQPVVIKRAGGLAQRSGGGGGGVSAPASTCDAVYHAGSHFIIALHMYSQKKEVDCDERNIYTVYSDECLYKRQRGKVMDFVEHTGTLQSHALPRCTSTIR